MGGDVQPRAFPCAPRWAAKDTDAPPVPGSSGLYLACSECGHALSCHVLGGACGICLALQADALTAAFINGRMR